MSQHEEIVTDEMLARTRLRVDPPDIVPNYFSPKSIGRHIPVRVGGTDNVVCFYLNCNVTGTRSDLTSFNREECQRRDDDDKTRDSWGSVRP